MIAIASPIIGSALRTIAVIGLAFSLMLSAAKSDDADTLDRQAIALAQQRQLDRAIPLFQRVLALRERKFGVDSPKLVISLNNLALAFNSQGRWAEAVPFYERDVAILQRAGLSDGPPFASALNDLAIAYVKLSRYAEAEPLMRRVLSIRERGAARESVEVLQAVNNLAVVEAHVGRVRQAESLYRRALSTAERILGPDNPEVARSGGNLANLYKDHGRYAEAEPLYIQALTIYAKAKRADSLETARVLVNLAELYRQEGHYTEGEAAAKRASSIRETLLGPNHPDFAAALDVVGEIEIGRDRPDAAEPLFQRALGIREKTLGPDHPEVALSYENLASVYAPQGRLDDAGRLLVRALNIRQKVLAPDDPLIARSLYNLAVMQVRAARLDEAEPLFKRALAIREKDFGPDHIDVGETVKALADLYQARNQFGDAETAYKRAIAIDEKALGPRHPTLAAVLSSLGNLYIAQKRGTDARPVLERAIAIRETAFGPENAGIAGDLNRLAVIDIAQGRYREALAEARRAVAIYETRAERRGETADAGDNEQEERHLSFVRLVYLLSRGDPDAGDETARAAEAFRTAQFAGGVATARALAGMTARYAAGSDALAVLVRERQDLESRARAIDQMLVRAVSQPSDDGAQAATAAIRQELADITQRESAAEQRLREGFPRFAELSAARPVEIADVQKVLGPKEALIAWQLETPSSFLFVVRRDRARLIPIDVSRAGVTETVKSLRASLDLAGRQLMELEPLDLAKAYGLYHQLLGPAEGLIADADHLVVVPDGPMQSLPPAILVTEPFTGQITTFSDYKRVSWLARRFAVSVLPAASSLVALRTFVAASHGREAFVGFGNPNFAGSTPATKVKPIPVSDSEQISLFRGAAADLDGIRHLPPLPDTALELKSEAGALDVPLSNVYLGDDATVSKVQDLDLSDVRVLAFATHGLIAGELPKLAEPALALTPPAEATDKDDGLLRASQVSRLKLNADWVLLSACNTAASDGTPGAEGLSGLAKAFFYAGARAILVSHWPVDSAAAVKLTTGALRELGAHPAIGRAEALRRSIVAMIDSASEGSFDAHPMAWAPFILAGEGGAQR